MNDHICAVCIVYTDRTIQARKIGEGTKEEMEQLADSCPAVSYAGDKQADHAFVAVMTQEDWKIRICNDAG